ncbi:HIRAN domain-containing protein [Paenibacillus planticolens]|uniref:HIRAN domain-containing protein n=1 Tax=Paenibacillus planticolens TaxID=2654976 RepID=A0ABX1ZHG7_9BACL|nr:HIRAN domain-containing protein [Paenibacillus planticolens]NOU99518.1 hypothetical protein [Paenibacillus planticolens]
MKESVYIAVRGMKHYFGSNFIKTGQVIHLVKEPDNRYDQEAIRAVIALIGKIGSVANSTHTVPWDSGAQAVCMIVSIMKC